MQNESYYRYSVNNEKALYMLEVSRAVHRSSSSEKSGAPVDLAPGLQSLDDAGLSAVHPHGSTTPLTESYTQCLTLYERTISLLYQASMAVSRRAQEAWDSDSSTAVAAIVPLHCIDHLANRPLRQGLIKLAGASSSPHLKTLVLSAMIEREPRSVPDELGRLLHGDCKHRYALACHLLEVASCRCSPELFQHCTPTTFGIQDQQLQRDLYSSIVARSFEHRDERIFYEKDIELLNALSSTLRTQVYAWILETKGVFPSDSALLNVTQDEYMEAYRTFFARLIENPDRFYKSVLHDPSYETPIQNPDARLSLFKAFYEAIPKAALQCIDHFKLHECESEAKSTLARTLYDDSGYEALFALVGPGLSQEAKDYILQDALVRVPDLIFHWPIKPWFPLSETCAALLFQAAIATQHWDRAIDIAALSEQGERGRISSTHRLDSCKKMLKSLESVEASEELSCFQKLLEVNITPSDFLNGAFHALGTHHQHFLIRIVATYGETFGSSVLHELRSIIKSPEALDEREKQCILDFLATGFRGFSVTSYSLFKELWLESREMAAQKVEEWKELGRAITTNQSLSKEQTSHPIYWDCVYAAYKPVGISRSEVAHFISSVTDHSSHLKTLTIKQQGYRFSVAERGEDKTPDNGAFDPEPIQGLLQSIYAPQQQALLSLTQLKGVMLLLLKGDFDGVRKLRSSLLASLVAQAPTHPAAELYRRIQGSLQPSGSVRELAASVDAALELQQNVFSDLIRTSLPSLMSELNLTISPFVRKHVCRILALSSDSPISERELLQAIQKQFPSLFTRDSAQLVRERKTIAYSQSQKTTELIGYVTKSTHSFLGRAAAGICTALDTMSWRDKNWFQMNIFEPASNRFVGNIQFHRFALRSGEKGLLARFNPTSKALLELDGASLADKLIRVASTIAASNKWQLYIPENTEQHLLSNRLEFVSHLEKYQAKEITCDIRLSELYECKKAYAVNPIE